MVVGLCVFDIGFYAVVGSRSRRHDLLFVRTNQINDIWMKRIIFMEGLVILLYLVLAIRYVSGHYTHNFYFSLKYGSVTGEFRTPILIGYLINFSIAFSAYVLYQYLSAPSSHDKRILIIQIVIGIMGSLMTLGRTTLFLYIILMLSIFLVGQNVKQKQILKFTIGFLAVGVVFFGFYNVLKYPYKSSGHSLFYSAIKSNIVYLSGSLVAFEKWAEMDYVLLYGANTFRFFIAVLNRLGFEIAPQNLVNPFIDISLNQNTNVYTIYYYYVSDFGLWYGYAMQLLIGGLHGILYKKLFSGKAIWLYLFSLSLYPLSMQFFQDQYLSLTSTWIQFIFYGFLFFSIPNFKYSSKCDFFKKYIE